MTAPLSDEPVIVGVVTGAHGNGGLVRVQPETDNPLRFRPGGRVEAQGRSLRVERARPAPGGALLVKFEGVADRSAAAALNGAALCVAPDETPEAPPGVYYHYQLIGLDVVSAADGEPLGTLAEILSTGANDVYVVERGGAELLLPAIADVIVEVDAAAGRMAAAVPDGLEWRTPAPPKGVSDKRPARRRRGGKKPPL